MKFMVRNSDQTVQEIIMCTNIPELGCKKKFNVSTSDVHNLNCVLPVSYDEDTDTDGYGFFNVEISTTTIIIPTAIYEYFADERFNSEDEFKLSILRYIFMQWRRELGNGLKKTAEEIWDLAIIKNALDKFMIQLLVKSPTTEERLMIDAGMTAQVLERYDAYYKIHRDWIQQEKDLDEFLKDASA